MVYKLHLLVPSWKFQLNHFCHYNEEIVGLEEDPDSTNLKCKMFGGFSYDIQINTTNPEDMDNLDILLNFDWMNHVANQMETEMAFQMERKYPKEQDRKVLRLSRIFDE